jgi:hypothetical protein
VRGQKLLPSLEQKLLVLLVDQVKRLLS